LFSLVTEIFLPRHIKVKLSLYQAVEAHRFVRDFLNSRLTDDGEVRQNRKYSSNLNHFTPDTQGYLRNIKITVFRNLPPYSLVDTDVSEEPAAFIFKPSTPT
jgi:hypothetical protein